MESKICRFCSKEQEQKHCVSLFSNNSVKQGLPQVLSYIFDVVVDEDGRSRYGCQNCISTAKSLVSRLKQLRGMAQRNYADYDSVAGIRIASKND